MDANGSRAGGLAGTVISVRKIINDYNPSNVLVVWDGEGGSQRRKAVYKDYKAGRTVRLNRKDDDMSESPEEGLANLREQMKMAHEYLALLGVPQVRVESVEADDVIAYIAGKMENPNGVIIVSTDHDFLQLIRKKTEATGDSDGASEVKVYSPVKKVMYDYDRFFSDFGVLPENYRLVKALCGDSSDNIDGIKGFGLKTTVKMFPKLAETKLNSIDIMMLATELKAAVGKRLLEEKNRFLENLRLVDLSEPMLSATAGRQAREALGKDHTCKEVDFRMRVVRDGISFSGNDFTSPFRGLVMRRRKLLTQNAVPAAPPLDLPVLSDEASEKAIEAERQFLEFAAPRDSEDSE